MDPALGFGYAERGVALAATGRGDEAARAFGEGILRASTAAGRWYPARLLLQMCDRGDVTWDVVLEVADSLMVQEHPSRAAGELLRGSALLLRGQCSAAEETVRPALAAAAFYRQVFDGPDAETILSLARLWTGRNHALAPLRENPRAMVLWPTAWLIAAQLHADAEDWGKALLATEAYYSAAGPDGLVLPRNAPIAPVERRLWEQLRAKAARGNDEPRLMVTGFASAALGNEAKAADAFGAAAKVPNATALARAGASGRRGRELVAANEEEVTRFVSESLSP